MMISFKFLFIHEIHPHHTFLIPTQMLNFVNKHIIIVPAQLLARINILMLKSDQSSSDEEKEKQKKVKKKKVIPLMDPSLKVKVKSKSITINVYMTKYDVVVDVAEQLGWNVNYTSKKGDWDVLWTDSMVEPEVLIKMHFFQKINHFPGIHVLARKNLLGISFMEMRKKFPQHYCFFPRTWLLPNDYPQFRQQVEKGSTQDEEPCYIVKPEADCQGRGIFLTLRTDEVENGKHYVVQDYISRPFLVDGLKFDFRVYVLLCGTNPMRLYCYEEGLARFATEKYQPPQKNNLKKLFMHLTNYAINKKNPKFVYNTSIHNMGTGHKRSMTSVFKDMKRRGFNVESLKQKMDDVLTKTLIIGLPLVSHQYKFAQPDDDNRNMCFHILGIDIMIDQLLNPIVLEVNHTPSFATDTPLDYYIKFNLIKDTMNLLNINEEEKKNLLKKTNSYQRERVTNAKRLIENEEKKEKIQEAQKKRDQYEDAHLGRYRRIYPVEDQKKMEEYDEFIKHSEKIYFSENNQIRTQIQIEKQKEKEKERPSPQKMSPVKSALRKKQSEREVEGEGERTGKNEKNINTRITQSQCKNVREHELILNPIIAEDKTDLQKFPNSVSLLNHPLSNLIPTQFRSGHFTPSIGKKLSASWNRDANKFTKSVNQMEIQEQYCYSNFKSKRTSNLPKIEPISTMKSSTLQISKIKNKNRSEFKNKFSDNSEDPRIFNSAFMEKKGGSGTFLTPKIMKFQSFQEKRRNEEDPFSVSEKKQDRQKFLNRVLGL